MKFRISIMLACLICIQSSMVLSQDMRQMWGESSEHKNGSGQALSKHLFDEGNYAMFIHWGLYSQLGNRWKGKTYYGIGEWMMNSNMAGIPVDEYKPLAADFNPVDFDAQAIARLAKDAGMKYIVITSKHHDGFAMYNSQASDFNIVKQTPFARDPMMELAQACRDNGLGFGFYYSHNQDWTFPGGNGGPATDDKGVERDFDYYFNQKCLPQVEEITRSYGDIVLVWFDTPGGMPEKYAQKLVEVVHHNQPNALVSGRVGYNMGDYQTLGDMEVPLENVDGLWESVDVTNDSWGYAWYDQNWKTPKQIIGNIVSTVARGGTYMLNVGPDGKGNIPQAAQMTLLSAGKWIKRHPDVIYGAGASPWKHVLPWGDVTTNKGNLLLSIFTWPSQHQLYVPGVKFDVAKANLLQGDGKRKKLQFRKENNWLIIDLPSITPDPLANVVELVPKIPLDRIEVDGMFAVDPELGVQISTQFAKVNNGSAHNKYWMEKFGEWKTAYVVDNWSDNTSVSWDIEVKDAGMFQVELKYAGASRMVWSVATSEGEQIQNQQNASQIYTTHPIGWLHFRKPGKHTITVKLLEGTMDQASLMNICIKPFVIPT